MPGQTQVDDETPVGVLSAVQVAVPVVKLVPKGCAMSTWVECTNSSAEPLATDCTDPPFCDTRIE